MKTQHKHLVINKHNSLTDAQTGHLSLGAEKVLNLLYFLWIENKKEVFQIKIADLKKMLNMTTEDYIERIISYLEELTYPMAIRNFETSNGKIEYHRSAFIKELNIWKENRRYIDIEISSKIAEELEKKVGFTPLKIDLCNKFRSKYGYRIYQIYKRYEMLPNKEIKDVGYILFDLNTLNEKFGTSYKTKSEMLRQLNSGIKEVFKITGEEIFISWHEDIKKFSFSWKRDKLNLEQLWQHDRKMFIEYVRTHYINQEFCEVRLVEKNMVCLISVNIEGKLYDMYGRTSFNSTESDKIWKYFFNNQDKMKCLNINRN